MRMVWSDPSRLLFPGGDLICGCLLSHWSTSFLPGNLCSLPHLLLPPPRLFLPLWLPSTPKRCLVTGFLFLAGESGGTRTSVLSLLPSLARPSMALAIHLSLPENRFPSLPCLTPPLSLLHLPPSPPPPPPPPPLPCLTLTSATSVPVAS